MNNNIKSRTLKGDQLGCDEFGIALDSANSHWMIQFWGSVAQKPISLVSIPIGPKVLVSFGDSLPEWSGKEKAAVLIVAGSDAYLTRAGLALLIETLTEIKSYYDAIQGVTLVA